MTIRLSRTAVHLRHVEKGVGLLPGNDLVELVAVGHLTFVIVLLSDLDDEVVRFLVLESRQN